MLLFSGEKEKKEKRKSRYQRVLIPEKLKKIANHYICNNKRVCFPNTITLVLSEGCKEDVSGGKAILEIPNLYASIDIIDGQHRVFAYAQEQISDETRSDSRILASAIKFKTKDSEEKSRLAAKTFWTINSRQSKVKRSLLYLIKYGVLGDTDPEALAGEIIRQCNESKSTLGRIFKTHPLRKKNKFGDPPIPITTIVQELARLINIDKLVESNPMTKKNIEKAFRAPILTLSKPEEKIKQGKCLLEQYFSMVSKVFYEDWKSNSGSNILCANYIAALIRLLRHLMIEKGLSQEEVNDKLVGIKSKVRNLFGPDAGSPSFPKGHEFIPDKKIGRVKIFDFLKKPSKPNVISKR